MDTVYIQKFVLIIFIFTISRATDDCQSATWKDAIFPGECQECLAVDAIHHTYMCSPRYESYFTIAYKPRSYIHVTNYTDAIWDLLSFWKLLNEDKITHLVIKKSTLPIEQSIGSCFSRRMNFNVQSIRISEMTRTSHFGRHLFEDLPIIRELVFEWCDVINLNPSTFNEISGLLIFNITECKFNITEGTFNEIPNLEILQLIGKNLGKATSKMLTKLTKLESINLTRNELESLPSDFFANNKLLKNIIIKSNNLELRELPSSLFHGLYDLEKLELSNNGIERLDDSTFSELFKLDTLDLSQNKISYLSDNVFKYLTNLKYLFFEHNNLNNLGQNVMRNLAELRTADFTGNLIDFNEDQVQEQSSSPFYSHRYLDTLYLKHNKITRLTSSLFQGNSQLRVLDLRYNSFAKINVTDLQYFISLNTEVDLRFNNISEVTYDESSPRDMKTKKKVYTTFLLDENPIKCDCSFSSVLSHMKHCANNTRYHCVNFNFGNARCQVPRKWSNYQVRDLRSEKLLNICFEQTSMCPMGCDACWIGRSNPVYMIDCDHQNLTWTPSYGRPSNIIYTEYNLTRNRLREMPHHALTEYLNVTVLFLSYNEISFINSAEFPPFLEVLAVDHNLIEVFIMDASNPPAHLKMLSLNDNRISVLSPSVLKSLENSSTLKRLTLYANPLPCHCELMTFILANQFKWPSLRHTSCGKKGMERFVGGYPPWRFCDADA